MIALSCATSQCTATIITRSASGSSGRSALNSGNGASPAAKRRCAACFQSANAAVLSGVLDFRVAGILNILDATHGARLGFISLGRGGQDIPVGMLQTPPELAATILVDFEFHDRTSPSCELLMDYHASRNAGVNSCHMRARKAKLAEGCVANDLDSSMVRSKEYHREASANLL